MAGRLADTALVAGALPPDAMAVRGAFHAGPDDAVPGLPEGGTLVLLGWTGGRQWPAFAASPEAADGRPDPLDRWSRRLIDGAAAALGAVALYPFGGPPHHDFQGWALRAEPVARSPIGLLMHPAWGLWHAYRGALGFRDRLALAAVPDSAAACDSCVARPCLRTCAVGAFSAVGGYDVAACTQHIGSATGGGCVTGGCGARAACPVQPPEPYAPAQIVFHMRAFVRGQQRAAGPA